MAPRLVDNFERYVVPNRHPVVWFGEPLEMDRRLVSQSGLLMMGGVLTLDSHPGQGGTFSVTLTFRVPQD